MKIKNLVCSAGKSGFFFDDQKAVKTNAKVDGSAYSGEVLTEGFTSVRQAGESISVMIVLEDNQVCYGDCAAVQYSGAGGRDPLFLAEDFIPAINKIIKPILVGREITTFREMAEEIDNLKNENGKRLHTAIRYGVTQSILDAVAKSEKKLMAQVIANEYGLKISDKMIPIFTQSGDARYDNSDKMILKGADLLPHALINHVADKLGHDGEKLKDYLKWLKERILKLRTNENYNPEIHIDVYGTFGIAFDDDLEKISEYMKELAAIVAPFKLKIEGVVDVGEREKQIKDMSELRRICDEKNINVDIVADEWCNTLEDIKDFVDNKSGHTVQIKTPDLGGINNSIEAVIYCKKNNMNAYLGGTCNETDRSAQICMHIAMATTPSQVLAKPGMGVDEGFMIVHNEMQRILALKDIL